MTVGVVIPWRDGCDHRQRALRWTEARYIDTFPGIAITHGTCDPTQPFNRAEAILDGAERSDADVLIVADGDCWTTGIHEAIEHVHDGAPWAIPHLMLCRLDEDATLDVLAGAALEAQTNFVERPYKGHAAGTLLVLRRDVLFDVPPDVRCVGWGQEDDCWSLALDCLIGKPWRGLAPLHHLWHPPQPRKNRNVGTDANLALLHRYKSARNNRARMRQLVDESKGATHASRLHAASLDGRRVSD